MIFASCRQARLSNFDFTSRHEHAIFEIADSRIRDLAQENDANDEALEKEATDAAAIPLREPVDRAEDLHVLVSVHGYRNPFSPCARAYSRQNRQRAAHGGGGGRREFGAQQGVFRRYQELRANL